MEENKCCTSGECEKCKDKKVGACCCCKWSCAGKCRVVRIIVIILVLAFVFCMGASIGSHRDNFRERGLNQRFMLNRVYNEEGSFDNIKTGNATVQVQPEVNTNTTAPVTQPAPAKQ